MFFIVVAFTSVSVLAKVHSLIFLQSLTAICQMPRFRWRLEAEELQAEGPFGMCLGPTPFMSEEVPEHWAFQSSLLRSEAS